MTQKVICCESIMVEFPDSSCDEAAVSVQALLLPAGEVQPLEVFWG